MGNCLVHEHKVVKIMKMDGKILEYQTPLKVHQVLSDFVGHSISDTLPIHCHLHHDTELLNGHLYYLLPPTTIDEKASKVSNPKLKNEHETSVVRIKLVITKQELAKILAKGGVSLEEMESSSSSSSSSSTSTTTKLSSSNSHPKDRLNSAKRIMFLHSILSKATSSNKGDEKCKDWKPILESIPE